MEDRYDPHTPAPQEMTAKWLRILFYVQAAALAASLLSFLPLPNALTLWFGRAVVLGVVICMYQLSPAGDRYRKAFLFRGVMLALTLVTMLLYSSTLLALAASILSILATYQEYSAHSDLTAEADPKLSRNWHRLFNWQLVVGILTSVLSMAAVLVLVSLEMDAVRITAMLTGALNLVGTVLQVIYLIFLNRMVRIFNG